MKPLYIFRHIECEGPGYLGEVLTREGIPWQLIAVDAGEPAVLYYEPRGSALDQIPASTGSVSELYGEYGVASGHEDNFLAIMLDRLEQRHGLTGFASEFTDDFEAFLASVDLDDETEGNQPYLDPWGDPILTLADTLWFGPAGTWPSLLENHPYIHYWHRLDAALLAQDIPGMGPEVLGDDEWDALFDSGPLDENPFITVSLMPDPASGWAPLPLDQLRTERPAGTLCDIGEIELGPQAASLAPVEADRDRPVRSQRSLRPQ